MIKAEAVVEFLRANPDFLAEHGELFTDVLMPDPHSGQAISLVQYQLQAMRDKVRLLEEKLAEMVRFGEENDAISTKVHRLAQVLLEADSYEAVRDSLLHSLHDDFAVPHVRFLLWAGPVAMSEGMEASDSVRQQIGAMAQPYCGVPDPEALSQWFDEAATHIRSVALLPLLRNGRVQGVLALASEDEYRFYRGMGTLYLTRIGELLVSALKRVSE